MSNNVLKKTDVVSMNWIKSKLHKGIPVLKYQRGRRFLGHFARSASATNRVNRVLQANATFTILWILGGRQRRKIVVSDIVDILKGKASNELEEAGEELDPHCCLVIHTVHRFYSFVLPSQELRDMMAKGLTVILGKSVWEMDAIL